MKRALYLISLLLMTCACTPDSQVTPNGHMTSEDVVIENSFREIYVENGIIVSLRHAGEEKVAVIGDSNIIPYVNIYTTDDHLHIEYTEDIFSTEPNLKIYVDYVELRKISAEDRSLIEIENAIDAQGEDFVIEAEDRAKIDFMYGEIVNCRTLEVSAEDESEVKLAGEAEEYRVSLEKKSKIADFRFKCRYMMAYVDNSILEVICSERFSLTAYNESTVRILGGAAAENLNVSEDSELTY